MSLAVRIVSVPERSVQAAALQRAFGGRVIVDEHHGGTFPNHLRALASVEDATHAVILEDDAIPCPDFLTHVARVIDERPDHLLGLYVGRSHPKRIQPLLAELTGGAHAWLDDPRITDRLRWAVGYVMPTPDIPAVLHHLSLGGQHPWIGTDTRIGAWHAAQGRLSYPFPSLVDHDDALPSTTSRGRSGRSAWAHCRKVKGS